MKTLSELINSDQFVSNVVCSEINRGRNVYLCINTRTGGTIITSKPSVWGGENNGGIGAIDSNDPNYRFGDVYSTPVDEINSVDQLMPFATL